MLKSMMSLLKQRRGEAKSKSDGSLLRVSWGLGPWDQRLAA